MVNEHKGFERTIIHPVCRSGNSLAELDNDFVHVVVAGFSVHDHAIMAAVLVEVGFAKVSYLDRRIHQTVIVARKEGVADGLHWGRYFPSRGKDRKSTRL